MVSSSNSGPEPFRSCTCQWDNGRFVIGAFPCKKTPKKTEKSFHKCLLWTKRDNTFSPVTSVLLKKRGPGSELMHRTSDLSQCLTLSSLPGSPQDKAALEGWALSSVTSASFCLCPWGLGAVHSFCLVMFMLRAIFWHFLSFFTSHF